MANFKVGDTVTCINDTDSNFLKKGKKYTVVIINYENTHVIVTGDDYMGGESTYSVKRFEVYNE